MCPWDEWENWDDWSERNQMNSLLKYQFITEYTTQRGEFHQCFEVFGSPIDSGNTETAKAECIEHIKNLLHSHGCLLTRLWLLTAIWRLTNYRKSQTENSQQTVTDKSLHWKKSTYKKPLPQPQEQPYLCLYFTVFWERCQWIMKN